MKFDKINPWNWFKHEEQSDSASVSIPVSKSDVLPSLGNHPFGSFVQLHREMDRLFNEAFRSFGMPSLANLDNGRLMPSVDFSQGFKPSTDISGDDKKYEISIDLPGMKESDVSVELKDRTLTIKGETESNTDTGDKKYYRVERYYGSFQRTLALPEDAAADRTQVPDADVKKIAISS